MDSNGSADDGNCISCQTYRAAEIICITEKYGKIEQFAEQVKKAVPADTVGFGEGIDEIYSYLGWNTGYFGMDMPDILYSNQVCVDYIFNLIEESDSIFVNDDSLNTLSYYFGNNTWKEEYFLKNYTCTADLYYEEGSKYNYRLYIKNK